MLKTEFEKRQKRRGRDPRTMQQKLTTNALNNPCRLVGRNTSNIEKLVHRLLHHHHSMWTNIVILAAYKEKERNGGSSRGADQSARIKQLLVVTDKMKCEADVVSRALL